MQKFSKMCSIGVTMAVMGMLSIGWVPQSAGGDKVIVFGDQSFDSIRVHNRIAGFIAKHGFGYQPQYFFGETAVVVASVARGDIDVDMECWVENVQQAYDEGITSGDFVDLGSNFPDSWQGWLVPSYVIKGDPERGIKPMAPDLKSVFDMPKYWKLFRDREDPSKGRFVSCVPGWGCQRINRLKFEAYGLDETYNILEPGSDAALAGSLAAAYKRGKPWFGYYWAPTWVMGQYDLTPLEEPAWNAEKWTEAANYACAYPSVRVNIIVTDSLIERAPEVVAFLKNYETTLQMNNKMLAYKRRTDASDEGTAFWFFKNYEDVWTTWLPDDITAKVKAALP